MGSFFMFLQLLMRRLNCFQISFINFNVFFFFFFPFFFFYWGGEHYDWGCNWGGLDCSISFLEVYIQEFSLELCWKCILVTQVKNIYKTKKWHNINQRTRMHTWGENKTTCKILSRGTWLRESLDHELALSPLSSAQ